MQLYGAVCHEAVEHPWGAATAEKRRSRTHWGTETVQESPMGRRPCAVRIRSGRVALPEVWYVN